MNIGVGQTKFSLRVDHKNAYKIHIYGLICFTCEQLYARR